MLLVSVAQQVGKGGYPEHREDTCPQSHRRWVRMSPRSEKLPSPCWVKEMPFPRTAGLVWGVSSWHTQGWMGRSALLSCFQTPPTQLPVSFCVFLNHHNKYISKLFLSVLLKTQKRSNVRFCSGGGGPQSHAQAGSACSQDCGAALPGSHLTRRSRHNAWLHQLLILVATWIDGEAVFLLLFFFFPLLPEL